MSPAAVVIGALRVKSLNPWALRQYEGKTAFV